MPTNVDQDGRESYDDGYNFVSDVHVAFAGYNTTINLHAITQQWKQWYQGSNICSNSDSGPEMVNVA